MASMDDGLVTIPGGFFKNPAGIRVALKVGHTASLELKQATFLTTRMPARSELRCFKW